MSVAPPTGAHELVVRLAPPGRRRGEAALRFSPQGVVIEHSEALVVPLRLPLAALALATVDPGPASATAHVGRLPVLRRVTTTAVVPRELGVAGWLWTSRDGSALPSLAGAAAPNGALLFTKPLAGELVTRCFAPAWVRALAARSPLGEPVVPGLLLRLRDATGAQHVFRGYGLVRPLTDREVPPAMRRALPSDVPADPRPRGAGDDPRAATSVAPPGVG